MTILLKSNSLFNHCIATNTLFLGIYEDGNKHCVVGAGFNEEDTFTLVEVKYNADGGVRDLILKDEMEDFTLTLTTPNPKTLNYQCLVTAFGLESGDKVTWLDIANALDHLHSEGKVYFEATTIVTKETLEGYSPVLGITLYLDLN